MSNDAGIAIVGTGLSAMACAKIKLLAVLSILDAGEELPEDCKRIRSMKWAPSEKWDHNDQTCFKIQR